MTRHDDGAWQTIKTCPDATAPDARAKLISIQSRLCWCMVSYNSSTDETVPDSRAKLDKSISRYDDGAWPTRVSGTDATAPDAKAKMVM